MRPVLVVLLLLFLPVLACAADPAWMARAEALRTGPGGAGAATAFLTSLSLPERQTTDYQWELALVARSADDVDGAAESHTILTLLLPGCSRNLAPVRAWLTLRARELYARAVALPAASRAQAATLYAKAVKADGAVFASDDHGLGAAALEAARAAVRADPKRPALQWELGWQLYLRGDVPAAREAFAASQGCDPDPYGQWRCQLWLARIDGELSVIKRQEQESDARRARERVEEDKIRDATEKEAAVRRQREKAQAERAERDAARARVREIDGQLRQIDNEIQTARERQMFPMRQPGLPPGMAYDLLRELKDQESALREKKRQLEEERDSLRSQAY